LVGFKQRNGFFAHAAGVFQKLQFLDELVAFGLVLATEGIWVGTLLNLVSGERVCGTTRAGGELRLVNPRALGGDEPLLDPIEVHVRLGKRDTGNAVQFVVDPQQQREIFFD